MDPGSESATYAVGIIKEGLVSYSTNKEGVTTAILSELVLKRCNENYQSSKNCRKKVQQIKNRLQVAVMEKEIRDEADKRGRKVSESDFGEDDQSSQKSSRVMTSPPNY